MPVTVLIPALNPSPRLLCVLDALESAPLVTGVILVNDGSSTAHESIFQQAAARSKVRLLRHAVNLGKGAALKTGFNDWLCSHPQSGGTLVTADADGQHLPKDILAVGAQALERPDTLVLGTRAFSGAVPARSQFGNTLTKLVLRALVGPRLTDTQTGLRAIPRTLLEKLLHVRLNGYDFEMEMLILAARARIPISSVPISTVYFEGNRDSHFDPVLDSIRIYFRFVCFVAPLLLLALVDYVAFLAAFGASWSIPAAVTAGRFAALGAFAIVSRFVLRHAGRQELGALARYAAVALVLGCGAAGMIHHLMTARGWNVPLAKLITESALLAGTFAWQRTYLFERGRTDLSGAR